MIVNNLRWESYECRNYHKFPKGNRPLGTSSSLTFILLGSDRLLYFLLLDISFL